MNSQKIIDRYNKLSNKDKAIANFSDDIQHYALDRDIVEDIIFDFKQAITYLK